MENRKDQEVADSVETDMDEHENHNSENPPPSDDSLNQPGLKTDADPSLSSTPEPSFPAGKDVSPEGETAPVVDAGIVVQYDDSVPDMGDSMGREEEGVSVMGDCTSMEMGENISGLMDRLIANVTPTVIDLSTMTVAGSLYPPPPVGKSDKERSGAAGRERSAGSEGEPPWKGRSSEDGDIHHLSSPRSGQPPSGPFVVGNQVDIMTEMYSGKDSASTSSGGVVMENAMSSPSALDTSPFFSRSVLDAFKWPSVGIPSYPDRRTLKKLSECAVPRQQKVRTDLTLADKIRLINVSETTGRSQRSLAAEFHISVGSVNNILRRKREYKEAFENKDVAGTGGGKVLRCYRPVKGSTVSDLQRLVVRWVDMARVKVKPLTWVMVLDKVRELAARLKVSAAPGWLEALQQSLDIPVQAGSLGVRSEHNVSLMGMWRKMLPFLVQGYQPENIFSVTETTLYYKCLPDCCYVGGPMCQNCNLHLEVLEHRLTVLLCCNMVGERLKPLVISRRPCPPSMRSVALSDLPVVWCHQPTASVTPDIFAGWLRNLEASMAQQRRHIALFMEMTPSHLSATLLKHVSLKFYLDDSAHLLQPFNHSVVQHFKAYFRRRLLQSALAHRSVVGVGEEVVSDGGEQAVRAVTELDAVFWIQDAWRTVSLDTIRTSFHKAAFPHTSHPSSSSSSPCLPEPRTEPLPNDFLHLVQEAGRVFHFTPMDAALYAEFDSQLPCHSNDMEDWERTLLEDATSGHMTFIKQEPGVLDDVGSGLCPFPGGEGEERVEKAVPPSEALESLSTLKRFSANNIGLLTTVFELESVLLDSIGPAAHT